MTHNQIEFWKLAWNNHYKDVELTLEAYKLSLEAENQRLQWAKLQEQVRATLVAEALNERKQILSEFAAEIDLHYKSAQIQKILAESENIKQQMLLSLSTATSQEYRNLTTQMFNIYKELGYVDINANIGLGGKGVPGGGASVSIKGSPFYNDMMKMAQELDMKRQEIDKLQKNLTDLLADTVTSTKVESQGYVPNIKAAKDNLYEDLEQHSSKQVISNTNVKQSNQTIGPGINQSSSVNNGVTKNSSSRNTNAPVARESAGPGSNSTTTNTGTKIISSNSVGPGVGTGSSSSAGKSSSVIYSPGVRSVGPGI